MVARVARVLLPDGREKGDPGQATRKIPSFMDMNDARLASI